MGIRLNAPNTTLQMMQIYCYAPPHPGLRNRGYCRRGPVRGRHILVDEVRHAAASPAIDAEQREFAASTASKRRARLPCVENCFQADIDIVTCGEPGRIAHGHC